MSSDKATPAEEPLTARQIAERLPGPWKPQGKGYVYPHPQRRFRVTTELNSDWEVLQYEERDPLGDSDRFANELLDLIGDELSARNEISLIRALVARLTAWQKRRGELATDDPVQECLEDLLRAHYPAAAAGDFSASSSAAAPTATSEAKPGLSPAYSVGQKVRYLGIPTEVVEVEILYTLAGGTRATARLLSAIDSP